MNDYNAPRRLAVLLAATLAACSHAPQKPAPAPEAAAAPAPAVSTDAAPAPAPVMQTTAPQRYTVKKGDTLWGISSMYLKDPWLWPDIWYANPAIKNPHLIYPGDVLILGTNAEGRPTLSVERNGQIVNEPAPAQAPVAAAPVTAAPVQAAPAPSNLPVDKLSPQVHYQPLNAAVTTVSLEGLRPFLSRTRVIGSGELDDSGYVLSSMDERPAMGAGNEIYGRGLQTGNGTRYTIYRIGDKYKDPDSGDTLGYEATYIGDAEVERWGDPQKLLLSSTASEVMAGDKLVPAGPATDVDLHFFPHKPAGTVQGQIAAVLGGVGQIGQFNVVLLNRGTNSGVDAGTVLAVYHGGHTVKDPTGAGFFSSNVETPQERSGTLMVFRAFKDSSYAVVMQATLEIHVKDVVGNP